AAGRSHLDHCLILGQPAPMGHYRFAQGAAYAEFAALTATGREHRIHRAFATVGHRTQTDLRSRIDRAPALGNGAGYCLSAEAFLERVGRNNQLHHSSTRLSSHTVSMPTIPCTRVAMVCAW